MGKFFGTPSSGGGTAGRFFTPEGKAQLQLRDEAVASTAGDAAQASGEAKYTEKASTNKKDLAEGLHKLHAMGKVEDFNRLADQTRDVFTPEEVRYYGLDKYGQGEGRKGSWYNNAARSVSKGAAKIPGATATGAAVSKAISITDRPRAVGGALLNEAGIGLGKGVAALDGPGGLESTRDFQGWSGIKRAADEHKGMGDLLYENLQKQAEATGGTAQVFGVETGKLDDQGKFQFNQTGGKGDLGSRNFGKAVVQLGGLAGDVATDPLSYVGGSSAARAGVKEAIIRDVGEATWKKIEVHGLEKATAEGIISKTEREAIDAAGWRHAEQLAERAAETGKTPGKFSLNSDVRAAGKMAAEGDVEGLAGKFMETTERQGRSGLRIGIGEDKGITIPKYPFGQRLPGVKGFDEAIMKGTPDAVEGLKKAIAAAPASEVIDATNIKLTTRAAEATTPKAPGLHVIDLGEGETMVGLRNADGDLVAYATLEGVADGAPRINLLHATEQGKGHAQEVLKGIEDAGISIDDVIKNSEFTDDGRKALNRYVENRPVTDAEPWRNARAVTKEKGAIGAIKETAAGKRLGHAFSPRSRLRAFSEQGADLAYRGQETAAARVGQQTHDMAIQLGKSTERAVKAFEEHGVPQALIDALPGVAGMEGREAWDTVIQAVLENKVALPDLVKALPDELAADVYPAIKAYQDAAAKGGIANLESITIPGEAPASVRYGSAKGANGGSATKHGGHAYEEDLFGQAPNEAMADTVLEGGPTMPRILTSDAEKLAQGSQALRMREALGVGPDASLRKGADLTDAARKAIPEGKTLREINEHFAEKLNLPAGTKLFEDDTLTAVALRSRASFEAATTNEMYRKLSTEMIDHDVPMLKILDPADKAGLADATKKGWKEMPGKQPDVGRIVGPPEVMDEMHKVNDMITNDESMAKLQKTLNGWNATWASYATNPLPFGMGFHSRNAVGNVVLAYMGGLKNPAKFVEAFGMQRDLAGVRKLMSAKGIDFEEALVEHGVSKYNAQMLRDMREHGIISSGFFADLDNYDIERLTKLKSGEKSATERVGNFINDNRLIHTNRRIGDVVENNARMALFIDAYEKGGSITAAADRVKKYLFDYGDLTAFEKKYMKSLNRFYTFTRKNVALQLYTLAHDPWKIKSVMAAEQGLFGGKDNGSLPDYTKKGGFGVSSVFGIPKGTEGVAYNIDTPFDNAIKTLDPIAQAVTMVPGIRTLVPPQYRSNTQELTRSVLNLRAGGPQEFVNFMFESATGKDTFSGKDITDESGTDTLHRLADAFVPIWSKQEKGLGAVGVLDKDEAPGMTSRLGLLQSLTGINLLPMTDKQRNQVAYVAKTEIQNELTKLRDAGVDVPTYSDLVRVGLAPDLTAPKDPTKTKARTSTEVTADTTDQINRIRAENGQGPIVGTTTTTTPKRKTKFFG